MSVKASQGTGDHVLSEEVFKAWMGEQDNHDRMKNYEDFDNYYQGNFDDIALPKHIEEALGVDVAIHANYCKPVVDIKVQYICGEPVGITVKYEEAEEVEAKRAEQYLYDVYRSNHLLYRNMLKTVRVMSKKGDVFLKAYFDEDPSGRVARLFKRFRDLFRSKDVKYHEFANKVKAKVLSPDNCYPKYASDDYETMELCAIKYSAFDDTGDAVNKIQVWYPDVVEEWLVVEDDDPDSWRKVSEVENEIGVIPVIHIKNTIDDREYGISDLHVMTQAQQLLNKTLTDFMLTEDYQAYQRVIIAGAMVKRGRKWDMSPGNIIEIPNPDAKVTLIPAAEIEPYLAGIKTLKETICEITQTPQIAFGSEEGGVPSGYALRIHYLPLENKCAETRVLLRGAFADLNKILFALAAVHGVNFGIWDSEIQLTGGLPIDKQQLVEQHEKQLKNGTLSIETAMQEEGIEDVDAELAKIQSQDFDLYGGAERAVIESEALMQRLESEEFTTTPRPAEVPAGERVE